jgi:hypothetical protein
VALVRRTDISEEHFASVFRVTRLARGEDVPYDGRRREPHATAPPQPCRPVTLQLLMGRILVECAIIRLSRTDMQPASSQLALGTIILMKNGGFLDVTPCGSCKNRRFGGT